MNTSDPTDLVARPLVVTLALDEAAQAGLDAQRLRWFPPGRTQVGAHVTLFHALPGASLPAVSRALRDATDRPGFAVEVTGLMPMGRGVAYRLSSSELAAVHALLREQWADRLTRQDAQPFRPHVTIQNKVSPEMARGTLATLTEGFEPFAVEAIGLDLWRYDGGPWTALDRFAFEEAPAVESRRVSVSRIPRAGSSGRASRGTADGGCAR